MAMLFEFMARLFGIYGVLLGTMVDKLYMINSCKPWGIDAFQSRNLLAIFFRAEMQWVLAK
jgi:hypothetical protein